MIVLLSPAKTLDLEQNGRHDFSSPRLMTQTKQLVRLLKKKSVQDLMDLMHVSEKIGTLNVDRYRDFKAPFTEENAKQSLFAFKGDVYVGLEAETLDEAGIAFAQDHIRILSGLYGILKPLDLMQAYRLEMGTKMENKKGKNLYEFWGDSITKLINQDLKETGSEWIVNLASNEYYKSVNVKKLKGKVLKVDFKEDRNGVFKIISFSAKKARGLMARYIIDYKIDKPEDLKGFTTENYAFNEDLSKEDHWVFTR